LTKANGRRGEGRKGRVLKALGGPKKRTVSLQGEVGHISN